MTDDELHALIENQGSYHKVTDSGIMEAMGKAREDYMSLAHRVVDVMPECPERESAVDSLMNLSLPMVMAGLARHQEATYQKWSGT